MEDKGHPIRSERGPMPGKKKTKTESTTSSKPKRSLTAKVSRKTSAGPPKKSALKSLGTKTSKKAVASAKSPKLSGTLNESTRKKALRQGETQMVAFIRDPQCIFTYWEVTPESVEAMKQQLMGEYKDSSMVLRVFKTGANGETELIQEVRVEPGEMNRYVELKDKDGNYFVEIAQKTSSGRIVVYARSNNVITGIPSETPVASSLLPDNQWKTPESLLEYFADVDETEASVTIPGISSAEAHQKDLQKKKLDRYSASRIG
jgi:hypothetical protein